MISAVGKNLLDAKSFESVTASKVSESGITLMRLRSKQKFPCRVDSGTGQRAVN
jgi:hypothetical protein